jgi:Flp pilus assembly protein TadG
VNIKGQGDLMRLRTRTNGRTERGAAAVEFALVVLPLLMIVAGIINFGFIFAQQLSLSNGARQAARFAVVDGPTCAEVRAEGKNSAATIGMTAAQVPEPAVSNCASDGAKPCAGTTMGTNITVTMTRSSTWVIPIPPFNVLTPPTLTGKGIMRCEFS